jgi:hypothetical protein
MGKVNAQARNVSATATGKAASVSRGHGGVGGALESVLAPSRRHTAERLGSVGVPQTGFAPQSDPYAGATLHNTRMLPGVMRYVDPFDDYSKGQ